MPQTTYNLDPQVALAGLMHEKGRMRGRYQSSEALSPGRIVEFNAGALRLPQGATPNFLGAVAYSSVIAPQALGGGVSPGSYASGDQVPVMRTGQIWLEYTGTVPTAETAVNVSCSSTLATNRGKVTASAPSASAGVEVVAVEGLRCVAVDTTLGLALCELNFPA